MNSNSQKQLSAHRQRGCSNAYNTNCLVCYFFKLNIIKYKQFLFAYTVAVDLTQHSRSGSNETQSSSGENRSLVNKFNYTSIQCLSRVSNLHTP